MQLHCRAFLLCSISTYQSGASVVRLIIPRYRAHLTQALSHRPIVHCAFGTLAAVRSTTLRSRHFDRYGRRCQFSCRQPRRRQRLGPYAYSYWTQEAKLKPESRQTAAQREQGLVAERLRHIPFIICSSYNTSTFPYTSSAYLTYIHSLRVSLLCYYSSPINCCMVEVRGMCLRIAYAQ